MEVSVTLDMAVAISEAYAELAWSVRPVKGLEPAAMVTAEAHAALASRSLTVLVGEAIATAAHAAKPKVNFILSK